MEASTTYGAGRAIGLTIQFAPKATIRLVEASIWSTASAEKLDGGRATTQVNLVSRIVEVLAVDCGKLAHVGTPTSIMDIDVAVTGFLTEREGRGRSGCCKNKRCRDGSEEGAGEHVDR